MELTTSSTVAELVISTREAVGNDNASEINRMIFAAYALRGWREVTDSEVTALISFAKRLGIGLTLLEGLASGQFDFCLGDDGQIRWALRGTPPPSTRKPM